MMVLGLAVWTSFKTRALEIFRIVKRIIEYLVKQKQLIVEI